MARDAGHRDRSGSVADGQLMAGPPGALADNGRAVAPLLRKTRMCSYHLGAGCRLGSECAFAHDEAELRTPPDLWKTRLCRVYMASGRCVEEGCRFAHGQAELRATGQFYKRTLCRFHQRGMCRNQDQCRFAHGSGQLRVASPRPPDAHKAPVQGEPLKVHLAPRRLGGGLAVAALPASHTEEKPTPHEAQDPQSLQDPFSRQLSELSLRLALAQVANSAPPGLGKESMFELALRSKLFAASPYDLHGVPRAQWMASRAA